jgi:hypothetical protein
MRDYLGLMVGVMPSDCLLMMAIQDMPQRDCSNFYLHVSLPCLVNGVLVLEIARCHLQALMIESAAAGGVVLYGLGCLCLCFCGPPAAVQVAALG